LENFRRKVFLEYLKAGALIVAYDAPFQITRIAIKWNKSLKKRRAFSFYFRVFKDKKTGKVRPSGYEPGLQIESLDASKAIYRFIKYKFHATDADREEEQQASVHVLDLKTLTAAVLTGEAYTFASACEIFGAPVSRARKLRPRVPVTYVDLHDQFPAVSNLLDCREILCAESLEFRSFTVEAREMMERITLDDCCRPGFWKQLRWFALVEAHDDVVPMRAKFG